MFPDIKGLLDSKLKEADKKYEPQGGLAVMMTARDHAALELFAVLVKDIGQENVVATMTRAFDLAELYVSLKKSRSIPS